MCLNKLKCKVISFTIVYEIYTAILERTKLIRDLEIYFDSELTFNYYINNIVNSACRTYGFIVRIYKYFSNTCALASMYSSLVRYKLEYGSLVLNYIYKKYTLTVENIQDVFYSPRGSTYLELLHSLHFQT